MENKNSIKFTVKINTSQLYRFLMYHSYHNFQGLFSIILAVITLLAGVLTIGKVSVMYTFFYFLFTLLFIVYMPVSLLMRAKRQVLLSPVFKEGLQYELGEEGITTSFGEEKAVLRWINITKIRKNAGNIIVYSSKVNAYILPEEELGSQCEAVKQYLTRKVAAEKIKW